MKASDTMLATYSYTQAELAIVALNPTIEAMAGYLAQNAISALCFAKYASSANDSEVSAKMNDTGTITLTGGKLRRFGASYYPSEWTTLFSESSRKAVGDIMSANGDELTRRGNANRVAKKAKAAEDKALLEKAKADVVKANPATTTPATSTVGQSA